MIEPAELGGRSQPAQSSTLSTMAPTRPATERIRNPNDALRPHRSIILFVLFYCFAVLTTTVRAAPMARETPSDELLPQSVQDGFYPYSVGNSTELKEMSRQAFYQLEGVDVPLEHIGPIVLYNENKPKPPRDPKKKRPGGKPNKKLMTKNQALKMFGDPNSLKHSQSCEGQIFQQRIKVPGCLTKSIKNKFCHGLCSSFFIPRLKSKLKAFFKSCAYCGPKEYDNVSITLDCPGQDPPQQVKNITKVKKCACLNHDFNL